MPPLLLAKQQPVEHNTVFCLDELVRRHPDVIVYGDYARAYYTKSFTVADRLHLVTNHSDVMTELAIIARQRQFKFLPTKGEGRLREEKNDGKIRLIVAKDDSFFDEGEDDTESIGYLTPEEISRYGKPSTKVKHIYQDKPEPPMLPQLANAIFGVSYAEMVFIIHLVKDIPLNTYIEAMNGFNDYPANKCWMVNGDFSFPTKEAKKNADERVIELVAGSKVMSPKDLQIYALAEIGWTVNISGVKVDPSSIFNNSPISPRKKTAFVDAVYPAPNTWSDGVPRTVRGGSGNVPNQAPLPVGLGQYQLAQEQPLQAPISSPAQAAINNAVQQLMANDALALWNDNIPVPPGAVHAG